VIFPHNFEEKVGFDQIRALLKERCVSSMGEEYVDKMRFDTSFNQIEKRLGQTAEFFQILSFGKPFPQQNYFNLIPELIRVKLPGTYIYQEQLFDLKSSLDTLNDVINFLKSLDESSYPCGH